MVRELKVVHSVDLPDLGRPRTQAVGFNVRSYGTGSTPIVYSLGISMNFLYSSASDRK